MKYSIFLIIVYCLSININAQVLKIPKGIYKNFDEVKAARPSEIGNYVIKKRSDNDIDFTGGNDFKVIPLSDSLSKRQIREEFYVISTGDSAYINGLKHEVQQNYCLLYKNDEYYYFLGSSCTNRKSPMFIDNTYLPGMGIISGIEKAANSHIRYLYAINAESGAIDVVTDYFLQMQLAKKDMKLFQQYRRDPSKDSLTTKMEYYKILMKLK
jgi:hypothetical protein